MKIAYIFVRFPVWSETFAVNDVLEMEKNLEKIDVYNLRPTDKMDFTGKSCVYEADLGTNMFGLMIMILNPILFFNWLFWLISHEINRPTLFIKCLLLGPQNFYIWNKIINNQYDIVHLFWGHFTSNLGYLLKKSKSSPRLSMFLGAYDLGFGLSISKDIANKADFLWTHSFYNLEQIDKLGVDSSLVKVVHRGVNAEHFKNNSLDKSKNDIVCIGRMIEDKGFDKVVEVFSMLLKEKRGLVLHLIGTGPVESTLKKQVKDLGIEANVLFYGKLSHEEVLKKLEQSNIFLFMSRYSGDRLPNVVKEAMAKECLCVVSNTFGIEELVINGETGFIVDKLDTEKAYEICLDILNSSDSFENMRAMAKKSILTNFTVQSATQKYLKYWNS